MSFSIPPFELDINVAYHKDSSGNEYFGWATKTKGVATSESRWKIVKIEYTGDNWIKKYADGDALYDNVWANVESLSYSLLEK